MQLPQTLTRVFATRPNHFVEPSRASILAHIVGMKFTLASGSGQALRYARNSSSRRLSLEFVCSIGVLDLIIPLFSTRLIVFGARR